MCSLTVYSILRAPPAGTSGLPEHRSRRGVHEHGGPAVAIVTAATAAVVVVVVVH